MGVYSAFLVTLETGLVQALGSLSLPTLAQRLGLCPVCHQVPDANPACDYQLYRSPSPPFSCAYRLPFTIFQGGMPRASYGDRHCISVVHNGQQTAFDFTSRVIDFTVLSEADPAAGRKSLEVWVLGRCKNEDLCVDVP